MAQQNKAHVPKFGNWDNAGNVPYTVYFENARKGKGGRMINPNDPAENPEAFSSVIAPSPSRSDAGRPPPPPTTPSPPPRHEAPRRGSGGGGRTSGSVGGGYSVEQSPVHPYSYSSGKAGDYSEDGGGFGLVANSVDRSRGNEAPTRGSAVPKFGDWDSNPASADGYTHIFNKVREEKQGQAGKPAGYGAHGNAGGKQHDDGGYVSSKFSCFGWCK